MNSVSDKLFTLIVSATEVLSVVVPVVRTVVTGKPSCLFQSVESTSSVSISMEMCSIAELPADRNGETVSERFPL